MKNFFISYNKADRVDFLLSGYLDHLRRKVSTVRIFGDDKPRELNQVFVELTLNEEYDHSPNQERFLGLMDTELRRMRSAFGDADRYRDSEGADDFPNRGFAKAKRTIKPDELLRCHTHAVVTGAPGCGKTTLLRYLAWQMLKELGVSPSDGSVQSQNKPPEGGAPNYRLPVFLELKQLTAADLQHAQNQLEHLLFDKAIAAAIKPGEVVYGTFKDRFLALLHEGHIAIFLDGLDEVSGAGFFKDLQRAITEFLHSIYGANTVIISTRPFALRKFGDAKILEIQPLNPRQIEQFIEHYYRDAPERQQFQRELQRRRELRELARVPALLGFILQLWRKRGAVADDKLELYEQITLELARHLDTDKEGVHPDRKWLVEDIDGSLKLDLLRQLAFNRLFKGFIRPPYDIGGAGNDVNRLVFTGEQLRDEAVEFARTLKEREGLIINSRNLAEDVKATALLRQISADHYAFAHLTLQEYLAAWQLAKRHDADTCESIFCRAYFNPMLAEMEVLPMTFGLVSEPDKLYEELEQLPESLDFKGLRLRARGLRYDVKISEQRQEKLIDRFIAFLERANAEGPAYGSIVTASFSTTSGKAADLLRQRLMLLADCNDKHVRASAVSALVDFDSIPARANLRKKLQDSNEDSIVRLFAFDTLLKIGENFSDERLLELANDHDWLVSRRATVILHRRHEYIEDMAIEFMLGKLKDEDEDVRFMAIQELGRYEREQVFDELVETLKDEDEGVRSEAAATLMTGFGDRGIPILLEALHDDAVSSGIESGLEYSDEQTSIAVLNALADKYGFSDETSLEELIEASTHRSDLVRAVAVFRLCRISGNYAANAVARALWDWSRYVRKLAIERLVEIGGTAVAKFLSRALDDDDEDVRERAAEALGRIGDKDVETDLCSALEDIRSEVRAKAAGALGNIATPYSTIHLLSALKDDDAGVRSSAASSLARMNDTVFSEGLLHGLNHDNDFVRNRASSVIGYYAHSTQAQQIYKELSLLTTNDSSKEVRNAASKSLQQFERKLQYFDIPIVAIATNDFSKLSPPPLLTAQDLAELETQIVAKRQEMLRGGDACQKGKALEELLAAVFASIPGFTVIERNYHTTTEEIDLVVRNASADPFWRGWGNLILVEAKHWRAQRVGKNEYVQFYRKMENRGGHCTLGFLICTERFAETVEKEMLRDSKFPLRVAPIDGEDLQQLVESQDRGEILRGFVERALLT